MKALAAMHVAVNAVLLGLGYYWLGLAESRAPALAWSALVALAVVVLASLGYGASLAFFGLEDRRARAAWRTALKNLLPLLVAAAIIGGIYFWLARVPATKIWNPVLLVLRWVAIPVLMLPMLAGIAVRGWRGFLEIGGLARRGLYWIIAPLLSLIAFWVPLKLIAWVPGVRGFGMEAVSFAVRAGMAYLLFVAAWLGLALATSGGKPRVTQSSTAGSV